MQVKINGENVRDQAVDAAIDQVGENAGQQWREEAIQCVIRYARQAHGPFLTEDIS